MKSEQILDLVNKGLNDVFGDNVRYDAGGVIYNPVGTFTDESTIVTGDGEVITSAPIFVVRKADLPSGLKPKAGHRITIDGQAYEVWDVRKDNSGAWLLALKLCGTNYG